MKELENVVMRILMNTKKALNVAELPSLVLPQPPQRADLSMCKNAAQRAARTKGNKYDRANWKSDKQALVPEILAILGNLDCAGRLKWSKNKMKVKLI